MVVKIVFLYFMSMPDIDHTHVSIIQFGILGIFPNNRNRKFSQHHAAGEKIIFMRAAGMGDDALNGHALCIGSVDTPVHPNLYARANPWNLISQALTFLPSIFS